MRAFFLLAVSCAAAAYGADYCDILFNDKSPIDAGHGVEKNGGIEWTSLDGSRRNYQKPPHWISARAKLCNGLQTAAIGPEPFGITCAQGGPCRVGNPEITVHFLPKAKAGDVTEFKETQSQITISKKSEQTWQAPEKVDIDKKAWQSARKP